MYHLNEGVIILLYKYVNIFYVGQRPYIKTNKCPWSLYKRTNERTTRHINQLKFKIVSLSQEINR